MLRTDPQGGRNPCQGLPQQAVRTGRQLKVISVAAPYSFISQLKVTIVNVSLQAQKRCFTQVRPAGKS